MPTDGVGGPTLRPIRLPVDAGLVT
ncbi:MAG: hypothetical protein QOI68_2218, partial [Pseudonocardiales bacterium]|nr:hypothetical protein [Pseudonocardiales bacterium]